MNRPPTSSEAADGALLRFTPRPRSASRSAARFPLAGASVPVLAIESREHRKRTCTVGGDPRPALRRLASCALPPSGPRRTTSRLAPFTPRSNNPAPSWGVVRPHHPATASWSPPPCRNRLPFLCRSQHRRIMDDLNSIKAKAPTEWNFLYHDSGIRKGVERYAIFHGLEIPKGNPGRPKAE